MNTQISLADVTAAFATGFATTRSFIRPCTASQTAPAAWVVRDPPGSKQAPRSIELVTLDLPAVETISIAAELGLGKYFVCALVSDPKQYDSAIREHKAQGMRLLRREGVFSVSVRERVTAQKREVTRVTTMQLADLVAASARSRQILAEHLAEAEPVCRLYTCLIAGEPVGWVRSIRASRTVSYVSNLFVMEAHRRNGIGRSLMSAMLDDDEAHGVEYSVLTASTVGALLYPSLGYQLRATLHLFQPKPPV